MGSQPNDHRHPVVEFSERLAARLDSLAGVPVTSMSAQDMREVMAGLARSRAQLDALQLRLLAEAEHSQATVGSGAATAADWLAVKTRQVRRDARSDLKLATRLEGHDCLAAAMGQGRVNLPQARAVVAALQRLPGTGEFAVTAEQRQEAEAHLVALAADHDAKDLRVLGRRIFEVVAPTWRRGSRARRSRPRRRWRFGARRSRCGRTTTAPPTAGSASPPRRPRCSTR